MNKSRMWSTSLLLICVIFFISYSQATVYKDYFQTKETNRATLYITADNYCQRTYSHHGSYLCRDNDNYKTNYESICSTLYCFDPIYIKSCVFSTPPQDSTLCGNGKWCETQSCQDNSNALSTSDACPLGDSSKPDIALNMNCKNLIAKRPSMCSDDKIGKLWCCGSCGALIKTDPATFTGPAKSANTDCQDIFGKESYFCQGTQFYKNQDFTSVCSRLFCYNPGSGNCEPVIPVDGVPCGNGKWCLAGQCAASSSAPLDPKAGCFYGNQYETFCKTNIVYPNIAIYCSQYEQGCCDVCLPHKNTSLPSGCKYGNKAPEVCQDKVQQRNIKAYCETNEADCCQTCALLKDVTNPSCPYGDIDVAKCKQYMNDSIGPGNCYSQSRRQECCDTCTKYNNASIVGCEYGDHWKDYCADNVVPPNVADVCSRYSSQCCGTCKTFEEKGHTGATLYVTADDYCQRTYSNGSYLCRDNDNYKTNYESICSTLYCFDAIYIKSCVFSIPPQDSTLCGNGKWCETQSCQDNSNALSTSDACPLGDSSKPDIALNMNCKNLIAKRPSMCSDDKIGKLWCCGSCGALNKTDPATFTGPAKSANTDCQDIFSKQSYFCQGTQFYKNQDFTSVCSRLFCYNPGSGNCEPVIPVDGVPCGNGKWCVAGQCAASSSAPLDPKAECFYGNQYETFCKTNIVYPNIATYCSKYEQGCCDVCLPHKNTSLPSGCQYGDKAPDVCKQKLQQRSIKAYCETNEADCCQTCAQLKDVTNPSCPYGDVDVEKCKQYMNDSIGPGNCYSQSRRQECCDTCTKYNNASIVGCEYGDHWKDYCADNVVPPNVADVCSRYSSQCCGTCKTFEEKGHAGCKYGDRDPVACKALMNSDVGTANCYNIAHQMQRCETCDKIKDTSTPGCVYGDTKPKRCKELFNDTRAEGNCYDLSAQIDCCRSCGEAKKVLRGAGCEYGDMYPAFCASNIYSKASAFLCFSYESKCCETCARYKVSDHPECKYGDKNPTNCKFQISNGPAALTRCPTLGLDCCETCSRLGHPGPGGKIYSDTLVG